MNYDRNMRCCCNMNLVACYTNDNCYMSYCCYMNYGCYMNYDCYSFKKYGCFTKNKEMSLAKFLMYVYYSN